MDSPGAPLDRGAIYYTLRIEIRTAGGSADFELSDAEKAFQAEVERFLESNHSPDGMDPNPEQLSQTVDAPPKRAFMRRIAELVTRLEVSRMLQRRVIAEAVKGGVPTLLASQYKHCLPEFGKRVANAALDILGPEGQLEPDEEDAPMNGRFERSDRYTVVDALGGGASEIQKNSIAHRGLGLSPTY